jgi:hypothetical protein
MSWIDKELRRRQKPGEHGSSTTSRMSGSDDGDGSTRAIHALWERFEDAHQALPQALQLTHQTPASAHLPDALKMCQVVLRAGNGAGLGFTGSAIRYAWPQPRLSKSHNFWIKCPPGAGFTLSRRIKTSMPGLTMQEGRFDERAVDHILRCLVTNRLVTWRSVSRRRFWLF